MTVPPGVPPGDGAPAPEDPELVEARTVRPYTVTGGRTRVEHDIALETLVRAVPAPATAAPGVEGSERRGIQEMVQERLLSVAELSAHLHLPVGVIRVLVGDLVDDGLVSLHGGARASLASAANLTVLESVLNGIDSL